MTSSQIIPEWWEGSQDQLNLELDTIVSESESSTDLFWALVDFYNHTMKMVSKTPARAAERGEAVATYFKSINYPEFEAMFLELAARGWLQDCRLDKGLDAFERMAGTYADEAQRSDVVELAKDVWNHATSGAYAADLRPVLLASVSRVFRLLSEPGSLVEVYLNAADLYSNAGAFAAAHRALEDAMDVSVESGLEHHIVKILASAAAIYFEEGDAKTSIRSAEQALEQLKILGEPSPLNLLVNLATAQLNLGEVDKAAKSYEQALELADEGRRSQILTNLASARRRQGKLCEALKAANEARAMLTHVEQFEQRLELELILAKIYAADGRHSEVAASLVAASQHLDKHLSGMLRLHHRRGLRERYIARFEGCLADAPQNGATETVLPTLASIYGSMVGDWLAFIDWADSLRSDGSPLSVGDREALLHAMDAVCDLGAPFLMGFKEKYDDPWTSSPRDRPWDELCALVTKYMDKGCEHPFAKVSLDSSTALLRRRLAQGYCMCFTTYSRDPGVFWIVQQNRYHRIDLDLTTLANWQTARTRFERKEMSRDGFKSALNELLKGISQVDAGLSGLPQSCPGIMLFQDFQDFLPINAVVLRNEDLRSRMASGKFTVSTIPALYEARSEEPLINPVIAGVTDSTENLDFPDAEIDVASELLECAQVNRIEANDHKSLNQVLAKTDFLIVATHGNSVGLYTDPFLASLGDAEKRHVINVASIQSDYPKLRYRVVALNACYGGAAVARNYQRTIRTHDAASYPALLLLNRRSVINASSWSLGDSVSFLHTTLACFAMKEGLHPTSAFCRATALLWDLTAASAIDLLKLAPQSKAATSLTERWSKLPQDTPVVAHPYYCGGIVVYSLV